jgi:hypothetical protein
MTLNFLAECYVKLVLGVGKHHENYVDAYYGPSSWKDEEKKSLVELLKETKSLVNDIRNIEVKKDELQRKEYLLLHLLSVQTFLLYLKKEDLTFDEESLSLYNAVSPTLNESELDEQLNELDKLLPGTGDINKRMDDFCNKFIIPKDKIDIIFTAAIKESEERTKEFISLDDNENFDIEYVNNQVWSGYNWYKGNSYSLIQLNTDFPIYIDKAITLSSHEGYPGHHVFNTLMEMHLVRKKGWIEYSIYALYSPQSLLSEGSANYGVELCFPIEDRIKYEKEVLFPLAGIDVTNADLYYEIRRILKKLSYAENMIAKKYLDGKIDKNQAIELLMKYSSTNKEKSTQRIGFIEVHRSYIINYNLGEDIVAKYVEKLSANNTQKEKWKTFTELLKNPKTASMMISYIK